MKPTFIKALLIGTALTFSQGAFAEGPGMDGDSKRWEEMKDMSPEERKAHHEQKRAKWESMSDSEKEAFKAERKAKWQALSEDEKVKLINERHDSMKKHMDEKWEQMSDAEKIEFAEKRMKRKHDGRKGKGRHHDTPPPM